MPRIIEVLEYDPAWATRFEEEAAHILQALDEVVIEVHHIGSTSVSGMAAKPVIDILLEVTDLRFLDAQAERLACLDYEPRGENGISDRRFFQKGGNSRTHHIHAFVTGSEHVIRHLYFRDYLIAHPFEAKEYSDIKRNLAVMHRTNPQAYVTGKSGYVQALESRARLWYLASSAEMPLHADAQMRQ
jgi:GrpB-like predicted nucleotidyltransferase (UPF0157 family)